MFYLHFIYMLCEHLHLYLMHVFMYITYICHVTIYIYALHVFIYIHKCMLCENLYLCNLNAHALIFIID